MRVAICQINPTVGDLDRNADLVTGALAEAEAAGADVAVLPELAITGYPPEDLVLRPGFVAASRAALERVAAATGSCAAVVGFVDGEGESRRSVPDMAGVESFSEAYNAVAVCANGEVCGVYRKRHLPNYDVFDEMRHFRPGLDEPPLFEIGGAVVGVTVCEDAWVPDGPVSDLARAGAQLVVNVNGSPFRVGKQAAREQVIGRRVAESGVAVVCVNLVGGQDELVFDGGSFVIGADGAVAARCVSFSETVDVFDVELAAREPATTPRHRAGITRVTPAAPPEVGRGPMTAPLAALTDRHAQQWAALTLATRDYVHKSGFSDVCVGLSGGVDSSLTAAVATDALGAEHVHGVLMPSRHSSDHSVTDAEKLAANLGIDALIVGIEPGHAALAGMIEAGLGGGLDTGGITDQNLQSRIRGVTLMALANERGWLVLTTGNKSELAVGYSTLYGDTAGAFAVVSDLWKLDVYELSRWRNGQAGGELIPATVLSKAPSAELAPDQRDDQSLPPYEVLDPILRLYVEDLRTVAEIQEAQIAPPDVVERVCRMVDLAEYKRRQTPIGPRLTGRAFGRDRRMPIVNRHR
ncbi:MAG: NAD+ synthase [Acidimicrobiaceae bacterium]|nr:NAD+ synthase [Acidimicrobiaceae bacterium]MXZ65791.1 NAD+ synthase [Acidimicrobiaceae bacterium]MYF32510.1 NAD+ synthase [Acidimicrobiaceae bacterium]MYG77271.1 NAD+ synthase [Acidimicrobiaceae bacterium]MYJ82621.1 NAD+ synthase [Acidimicrobiaceae bacterium]